MPDTLPPEPSYELEGEWIPKSDFMAWREFAITERQHAETAERELAAATDPCTDAREQDLGCWRAVKAENELAAARQDAERYRYLRTYGWDLIILPPECEKETADDAADLDAQIDAARKG